MIQRQDPPSVDEPQSSNLPPASRWASAPGTSSVRHAGGLKLARLGGCMRLKKLGSDALRLAWLFVIGMFLAGSIGAEDPKPELTEPPAIGDAAAESELPTVTITDKWTILVNPIRPRPGIYEFNDKSLIQNVEEFEFTGPMVGHPFGLGDFSEEGRWAISQGVVLPVAGKHALLHLATADEFELEGIIHQEKVGSWLMLLGWNQGHGYSVSNVTLQESGSPWFVCEYRGGEAVVPSNNEVKQFEWKADQSFRMLVKDKQLSVTVGMTAILEDYPIENYSIGDLFLGTYDTRYGPKPIQVRSLRIRVPADKPAQAEKKPEKKPEKKGDKKNAKKPAMQKAP